MLIEKGHESVIEHFSISVRFIVDRGVSHELVRHRLCLFSQESTRYCNYKGGVTFIIPPWVNIEPGEYKFDSELKIKSLSSIRWAQALWDAEDSYLRLLTDGWTPQQARSVLPNSLKTEIVCTANIREWRHILKLRTSPAAHPQFLEIAKPLLQEFKNKIPVLFDDLP
jgi:thymidylate synthase (FAD)